MRIENLKNKYLALESIHKFFFKAIFVYIIWEFAYQFFLKNLTLDSYLIMNSVKRSKDLLNYFGYDVSSDFNLISINNYRGVLITSECGILPIMGFYIAYIFAYPVKYSIKFFYIIIGIISLQLLNVLRISILTLTMAFFNNYWEFIHRADSYIIFYPIILILWYSISTFHKNDFSLPDN